MSELDHFLVADATGRQGGAVVKALLSRPTTKVDSSKVYALSRQSNCPGAQQLRDIYPGINIIEGDLNNPSAIFSQLEPDLSDAKDFIDAAVQNQATYFVYSSVDQGGLELSDKDPSYCKTFSDKFYIEKHFKQACSSTDTQSGHKMDYTILRPTWFADNAAWGFPGRLCMAGWRENMRGRTMQVTVTRDIGRWAVEALVRPDKTGIWNQALSIASDKLTFDQVDKIFVKYTGKGVPLTNGLIARGMIWMVKDLSTMFGFISERAYGAELDWLKSQVETTTFEQWVREEVVDTMEHGDKSIGQVY